jgi:ABC-type branched-subunit amino acid transport system substrate-binding protein
MKRLCVVIALCLGAMACRRPGPDLPPPPSSTFRDAENAFARGDYVEAAAAYRRFLAGKPEAPYLPRANYQLASAEYNLHQYSAALATLDELKQQVPAHHWAQVPALRGDAELGLGRRVSALLAWEDAWLMATPAEQTQLRGRFESTSKRLTEDERSEVDRELTVPAVRKLIGLGESPEVAEAPKPALFEAPAVEATSEMEAVKRKPAAKAQASTSGESEAESEPATSEKPVVSDKTATLERPSASEAQTPPETDVKVACLLPLTGPDHADGLRALAGLRLAFADAPQQLLVRDTGGQRPLSAELLSALSRNPEVMAIVGPLRSADAEAAAPLAERDRIPLLLLSQREGLTGRFVFQAAMTRTQEVELLVGYATRTLKLKRLGVVYPDDRDGLAFADAFRRAVTHRKAKISGAAAYAPGNPDISELVGMVKRWHASGLQALFIPDGATTATKIASRVRSAVPDLVLLGTESWNDPATLASTGSSINGALFTDAFFADSDRPSTRRFVERFEKGAGRTPTLFEAQAFDAGTAIRQALQKGAVSRDQMAAQLTALGTLAGAGELRASANGLERGVSLLRYHDGKVEEISAAEAGS